MEHGKFNKLLSKIKDTLSNLIKAVQGKVVFSPELEKVGEGCLTNKVPGAWKGVLPLAQAAGVLRRGTPPAVEVHEKVGGRGHSHVLLVFSVYFFQQAFLTGVKQNFARKDKIAIDQVMWNFIHQKADFEPDEVPEGRVHQQALD